MQLSGKKIVVTGGAGVLGESVAAVAKSKGAEVVLLDVVAGFTSELGDTYTVDLTDSKQVDECFAAIGFFDALANIAGGFDMGPTIYETEDAMWDAMFNINVTTLRSVLRSAVPKLVTQGHGSIINVGALGALRGAANMGAYTAAEIAKTL